MGLGAAGGRWPRPRGCGAKDKVVRTSLLGRRLLQLAPLPAPSAADMLPAMPPFLPARR